MSKTKRFKEIKWEIHDWSEWGGWCLWSEEFSKKDVEKAFDDLAKDETLTGKRFRVVRYETTNYLEKYTRKNGVVVNIK